MAPEPWTVRAVYTYPTRLGPGSHTNTFSVDAATRAEAERRAEEHARRDIPQDWPEAWSVAVVVAAPMECTDGQPSLPGVV